MATTNKNQQGAALISALLILAVCTALATFVLMSQRLVISQASLGFGSDRLTLMLHGVQDWAIETVAKSEDIHKVKGLKRTLNGVKLTGMIYSLDGRFNVNVLADTANIPRFVKLLKAVSPSMTDQKAQQIAMTLSLWVSQDEKVGKAESAFSEEKSDYPYPHQYITDLSELRLVPGISYALYSKLVLGAQPIVTALPTDNFHLNVNYANPLSLMTLDNVSLSQAKQLVSCREGAGYFDQVGDFLNQCARGMQIDSSQLMNNTYFFLVVGDAVSGQQHVHMQALLNLYLNNGKPKAKIIWQEYNGE